MIRSLLCASALLGAVPGCFTDSDTDADAAADSSTEQVIGRSRGRPTHGQGTLRSEVGSMLRGIEMSPDVGMTNASKSGDLQSSLTNVNGLNALHVYIENDTIAVGSKAAQMDELVNWGAANGYYIVIVPAHRPNGSYNEAHLTNFWNFYAPRYASRAHVIYEIANEPNWHPCSQSYAGNGTDVINMEKRLYTLIRSKAPNSEILLLTYSFPKMGAAVTADIKALSAAPNAVNWSHAGIAFHGYDWGPQCMGSTNYQTAIQIMKDAANGIPLVLTEFNGDEVGDGSGTVAGQEWWKWAQAAEATGISYLHFRWFMSPNGTSMSDFKAKMNAHGISWTPDFGSWPRPSGGSSGGPTASFKTFNDVNYLSAQNGGGGTVDTQRTAVGDWESFVIEDVNGGTLNSGDQIHVRTKNGHYLTADGNGGGAGSVLRANRTVAGPWETFTILKDGGGAITGGSVVHLKSSNNTYASAINGGGSAVDGAVVVDRAQASIWESFKIAFR